MKNKLSYFILSLIFVTALSIKAIDAQFNPKQWAIGEEVEFADKKMKIRDIKEFSSKTKNNTGQYKVVYYVDVPKENKKGTITVAEEYDLDKRGNVCNLIDSFEKFEYEETTILKQAIGYFNYWTQKIFGPAKPVE